MNNKKLKQIRSRTWYQRFDKLYKTIESKDTKNPKDVQKILWDFFDLLDHGAFRYQHVANSAAESMHQVFADNDPQYLALKKWGLTK